MGRRSGGKDRRRRRVDVIVIVTRVVIVVESDRSSTAGTSSSSLRKGWSSNTDRTRVVRLNPQNSTWGNDVRAWRLLLLLLRPRRGRRRRRRHERASTLRSRSDGMDVVTDCIFGSSFYFDLVARRQKCVKPRDEKRVTFEKLRDSIDHTGGVDAMMK